MNRLHPEKRQRLERALRSGLSIRGAAHAAGVARGTAATYAQTVPRGPCRCGDEAGHRGWCWWRVSRSPRRQRFLRERFGARHFRRYEAPRRDPLTGLHQATLRTARQLGLLPRVLAVLEVQRSGGGR